MTEPVTQLGGCHRGHMTAGSTLPGVAILPPASLRSSLATSTVPCQGRLWGRAARHSQLAMLEVIAVISAHHCHVKMGGGASGQLVRPRCWLALERTRRNPYKANPTLTLSTHSMQQNLKVPKSIPQCSYFSKT